MTAEAAASRAPAGEAGFRLLASRRQLAEAQRIAQVGSWEWELDGDEATLSDEVARILGLPPGSRLDMQDLVARFVHPADLDRILAHMERLPTDPTPFTLEHRIVRSDGAVRSVLVRGEGVVDEDGRVVRLIGTDQDITDRRLAAIGFKLEQARLRLGASGSPEVDELLWQVTKDLSAEVTSLRRTIGRLRPLVLVETALFRVAQQALADVAHFGLIAMRERGEAKLPLTDPAEGSGA